MKKFLALTLAVVMVLAVTSSAMAFSWGKPADDTADTFANRYKIEVVKLANETGIIGTNKLIEAPGATAVNNAAVYFYIRLTVTGADAANADGDAVQENAVANVSFTALKNYTNADLNGVIDYPLKAVENGVYYYHLDSKTFKMINDAAFGTKPNSAFSAAAIEARVLDTATAKVYAKVSAKRPLTKDVGGVSTAIPFNCGSYDIGVTSTTVKFYKAVNPLTDPLVDANLVATFTRDGNGKVTKVETPATANAQDVIALYQWLNAGSADTVRAAIANGEMYMTDGNIRAAFGFDYKGESSITWNANATAIILDPAIGVGIPKTGDNASVIGFAMVMIAVVGAAVAVKKVRA